MLQTKQSYDIPAEEPDKKQYLNEAELEEVHSLVSRLLTELERVIRGKHEVLELILTGLLAGGHILIEDLPGLGKTTLAKTLAALISKTHQGKTVDFKRIQFTPDLLPYDITGVDIYDQENKRFKFTPGPVFSNIILADEINRTTPKVQSALLEVMAENQVTVGNKTHKMDPFFFVIATQNPVEVEGTFPLPIAQLDRFLFCLAIGYPGEEEELSIVCDDPAARLLPELKPVLGKGEILAARKQVERVYCDPRLMRLAVQISSATRNHKGIELGASPRASLMMIKAARAYAAVKNRRYVIDQDLIDLAPRVLCHRLILKDLRLLPEALVRELALAALAGVKHQERSKSEPHRQPL